MSMDRIKNGLPEYAKDVKLNLGTLVADEALTDAQKWGCFIASAYACGNGMVIAGILADAASKISEDTITAAKAAAGIMAMNNIYYRFVHLASNHTYQMMQAKLRMNIIGNPGVDKTDFELWSLAVSAVNGCGMCIDSHEQHLVKAGVSADQIQTAVRIAAVVHAAARILDAEMALDTVQSLSAVA